MNMNNVSRIEYFVETAICEGLGLAGILTALGSTSRGDMSGTFSSIIATYLVLKVSDSVWERYVDSIRIPTTQRDYLLTL